MEMTVTLETNAVVLFPAHEYWLSRKKRQRGRGEVSFIRLPLMAGPRRRFRWPLRSQQRHTHFPSLDLSSAFAFSVPAFELQSVSPALELAFKSREALVGRSASAWQQVVRSKHATDRRCSIRSLSCFLTVQFICIIFFFLFRSLNLTPQAQSFAVSSVEALDENEFYRPAMMLMRC